MKPTEIDDLVLFAESNSPVCKCVDIAFRPFNFNKLNTSCALDLINWLLFCPFLSLFLPTMFFLWGQEKLITTVMQYYVVSKCDSFGCILELQTVIDNHDDDDISGSSCCDYHHHHYLYYYYSGLPLRCSGKPQIRPRDSQLQSKTTHQLMETCLHSKIVLLSLQNSFVEHITFLCWFQFFPN